MAVVFERLRDKHSSSLFVDQALGLVTEARNGLSTGELEDILSLNDDVLTDIFGWWSPPGNTQIKARVGCRNSDLYYTHCTAAHRIRLFFSFRFVSFRFVSFRFVSVLLFTLYAPFFS